jgi:hypothetical protein
VLDKIGQNWPQLAKNGHGWPNLDKAGQNWTAGGQFFPAVLWRCERPEECKAKTLSLFLAGLRGSASDRPLAGGKNNEQKAPRKTCLVQNCHRSSS